MTYEEIIATVAESMGLDKQTVDKTYKAYWRVIREHVTSFNLKDDLTDEEFLRLKPNVNIPSIGKLYVSLDRYHKLKKQGEIIRLNKEKYGITHQENQAS